MSDLHELAGDVEDVRRRMTAIIVALADAVLPHLPPVVRAEVLTARGLAVRVLAAQDAVQESPVVAMLVCAGGAWRLALGRSEPGALVLLRPLTDDELYAALRAVRGLDYDGPEDVARAVRCALPWDVVEALEHEVAGRLGLTWAAMWPMVGIGVRDAGRLIRVPEAV